MPSSTRLLVGALAILLAVSGCGFKERKDAADFLLRTASRAEDGKTAIGTLSMKATPKLDSRSSDFVQQGGAGGLGGLRAQLGPELDLHTRIDFENKRAALSWDESEESTVAIFDGNTVYMRRQSDRRPWVRLDFEKLDPRRSGEDSPPVGFNAMSPQVLVELIAGALTGSVENLGTETVAGAETTHFRANIDWEKATLDTGREGGGLEKLDEDTKEALARVYESMAMAEPVVPADIWLDPEGLPRKLQVGFEQRLQLEGEQRRSRSRVVFTMVMELTDFSSPVKIEVPSTDETIKVSSFGQLIREARRTFQPDEDEGGEGSLPALPDGVQVPEGVDIPEEFSERAPQQ